MHRFLYQLVPVTLLLFLLVFPSRSFGEDTAEGLTIQAQQECDQGRRSHSRDLRLAHFEKSQVLAERAVVLNDSLPEAHFALFCSLGEQLRVDGESLTSLLGFHHMMVELDRAIELNPDYLDALSAKASFLVRLPALLGGDEATGEAILRRVIREEPQSVNARMSLARCHANRGQRDEAMELAAKALELAHRHHLADLLPEAQQLVSDLESGSYSQAGKPFFASF